MNLQAFTFKRIILVEIVFTINGSRIQAIQLCCFMIKLGLKFKPCCVVPMYFQQAVTSRELKAVTSCIVDRTLNSPVEVAPQKPQSTDAQSAHFVRMNEG